MIHLHGHSTFSFLDGYGTPKQVAERLKELGHTAGAITDHGNLFAHVPWQKAARAAGIKPIFGCEFYISDDAAERTKVQASLGASGLPHVTVLALDQRGYSNLLKLSRFSWEHFYYKPRIDWNALAAHQEGLIVLSGCPGGYPSRMIEGQGPEAAWQFVQTQRARIEHFYIEIIPEPGFPRSHAVTPWLVQIAGDLQIPLVMTADGHFPRPEDHEVQDLMLCVGIGKKLSDPTRELRLPPYQYYCSSDELKARALEVAPSVPEEVWDQALDNSKTIGERCEVEIPRASKMVFPGLGAETSDEMLWRLVMEGALERWKSQQMPNDNGTWNVYIERAHHEFETLKRKGFSDYLLAIIDVVKWMKAHDGLVMLRGSAGGCCILWLCGASETDPILHGLSFERFYDENRPDPPDVDIDFERCRRDEAIQYIYQKYGEENCSQIAALSFLKAKAALQDAAYAYGIPRADFAALSEALNSKDEDTDAQLYSITDPRALAIIEKYPKLKIIQKMVGQCRQSSIHAAGVLVSSVPLTDIIGIVLSQAKQPVAAVDKRGAADLGLLKMDFLSVNSLDIIAKAARSARGNVSWLYSLPLDDERALAIGAAGMLAGIFQLDGSAAARVSAEIGLTTFDDIPAAGGLCRPGPAEWVPLYQRNKADPAAFEAYLATLHPITAEIVRPTYGVLLYQEQVMRLARELAGFDWPDVHKLRKGIADKVGLDPQKGPAWRAEWMSKFIDGATMMGNNADLNADQLWDAIESHGGYSFNKAHCYSYGIIGYWMLYLKAHYPAQFYEAYLSLDDDELTLKRLIGEFRAIGGQVKLLDPKHSRATFRTIPGERTIVGGYCNIRGIGPKTAEKLQIIAPDGFDSWDQMFSAMGAAQAAKIRATGVVDGDWNIQELIYLAPWMPLPATGITEAHFRIQTKTPALLALPYGQPVSGDAIVMGYVTATDFNHGKVIMALEDETRSIVLRVSAKMVHAVGPAFRQVQVADYIAAKGWWNGSALYGKEIQILARRNNGKSS